MQSTAIIEIERFIDYDKSGCQKVIWLDTKFLWPCIVVYVNMAVIEQPGEPIDVDARSC